ncbi:hypothetical protein SSBG_00164 [Streptomyces sp. SPB074]|nr:hypothetical protein SSBG_00164 [Streptomyces sp. SPB074]
MAAFWVPAAGGEPGTLGNVPAKQPGPPARPVFDHARHTGEPAGQEDDSTPPFHVAPGFPDGIVEKSVRRIRRLPVIPRTQCRIPHT